jgi:hypothetical protein
LALLGADEGDDDRDHHAAQGSPTWSPTSPMGNTVIDQASAALKHWSPPDTAGTVVWKMVCAVIASEVGRHRRTPCGECRRRRD